MIPARTLIFNRWRVPTQRRYVGFRVEVPSTVLALRRSARRSAEQQDAEQHSWAARCSFGNCSATQRQHRWVHLRSKIERPAVQNARRLIALVARPCQVLPGRNKGPVPVLVLEPSFFVWSARKDTRYKVAVEGKVFGTPLHSENRLCEVPQRCVSLFSLTQIHPSVSL